MKKLFIVPTLCFLSHLAACTTIDQNNAKALATAGQAAAQGLVDQTGAGRKAVDALPEWWGVRDALICSSIPAEQRDKRQTCLTKVQEGLKDRTELMTAQSSISTILSKRVTAASALRDAYQAFVNLTTYDAGGETEQAIKSAVGAVNELTAAAAAVAPQGIALAAIGSTFTNTVSGVGRFIASERQKRLILAANHDLHSAIDAMVKALTVERDSTAMASLLKNLQMERDQLYFSFVTSGLISQRDALAPLLAEIAPGAQMVQNPPNTNTELINTAANISIAARSQRQQLAVSRSYDAALATLRALSTEHAKLEEEQPLNLENVLSEVKRIQKLVADLREDK